MSLAFNRCLTINIDTPILTSMGQSPWDNIKILGNYSVSVFSTGSSKIKGAKGQLAVHQLAILPGRIEAGISNRGTIFLLEPVCLCVLNGTRVSHWGDIFFFSALLHRPCKAAGYAVPTATGALCGLLHCVACVVTYY